MKETLLQIVQDILSDMDSEEINSLTDTAEATQVATIVKQVYNNMINNRIIPEHEQLLTLTAASDSSIPTTFYLEDNVKEIQKVWYQNEGTENIYQPVHYLAPLEFLMRVDAKQENYVSTTVGGTVLRIQNNKQPNWFTSFDDDTIIMDSYDATYDTTLQESKIRAYGQVYPTFSITDSYVPDLDAAYFPYLKAEARSVAMDFLKGATTAKAEQQARQQRAFIMKHRSSIKKANRRPHYGRN